jgi:hypothetical protein
VQLQVVERKQIKIGIETCERIKFINFLSGGVWLYNTLRSAGHAKIGGALIESGCISTRTTLIIAACQVASALAPTLLFPTTEIQNNSSKMSTKPCHN